MKKENYKCSNIILTGFTNAGKSTLLNCIFKKKVSIVSSKVQTTKDKISGILNIKNTQLIFTDTPGLTNNQKFFDKNISRTLLHEEKKIDFNLFILDISKVINLETINKILKVVDLFENNYLVLNKIDLIKKNNLLAASKLINSKIKFLGTFMISAKKKKELNI